MRSSAYEPDAPDASFVFLPETPDASFQPHGRAVKELLSLSRSILPLSCRAPEGEQLRIGSS
jgi:hypothetical protein